MLPLYFISGCSWPSRCGPPGWWTSPTYSPSAASQRAYAQAIAEVVDALNREFCRQVDPAQLAAADAVLRVAITGDGALQNAASSIRSPAVS